MCFVATTVVPSVLKNGLKNFNKTQQQYNHCNSVTLICESIFFVPPFNYGIKLPHYNTTRHHRTLIRPRIEP